MAPSAKHHRNRHQKALASRSSKPSQSAEVALIIFAKSPIPGLVKTRLSPPLVPDEAATLHGSLILDTLEHTRATQGIDRFLSCAPSKLHPFFKTLSSRQNIELWEQVPEDQLGTRMDHAFRTAFDRGYKAVMMIGSDLPTIDSDILTQAIRDLGSCDVVIGPSTDGGYYLIGLTKPRPELFVDIPWSTDQVTALTQQKAVELGLSVRFLGPQRDLDTLEDLHFYIHESQGSLKKMVSSRTAQVFKTLATRLVNRE